MITNMKLTNGNTQNKQEKSYELIKARILDGTYGAGYRLVIDRLAKELGFSAIPVREAIRRLEAEGFVEYERFSGVRVIKIDEGVYIETLQVLAVLEGYATALACQHLTAQDFAQLRAINEQMRGARESFDLTAYSAFNQQFHQVVLDACGQSYLRHEIESAQERLDAVRTTVFMLIPHRTTDSVAEHEQLIRLMEQRTDANEIERFARAHKLATMEAFKQWQKER